MRHRTPGPDKAPAPLSAMRHRAPHRLSPVAAVALLAASLAGVALGSSAASRPSPLASPAVLATARRHAIRYIPVSGGASASRWSAVRGAPPAAGLSGPVLSSGAEDLVDQGNGPVMATSTTYAIYWSPAAVAPGSNTVPAADQALINRYFGDVGGTPLYAVLTQYSTSATTVLNQSAFGGSTVDST